MSRSLQLYQVYYRLHSDNILRFRFCLARNGCVAMQVLIRSLLDDGHSLHSFELGKALFISTYR